MTRVLEHEVLVIGFGRIERLRAFDPRDDRLVPQIDRSQLRQIGLGDRVLFGRQRHDRAAIMRPDVGALPVELGRIGDDRKEDAQQLVIADDLGIVGYPDRLGVVGDPARYELVVRLLLVPPWYPETALVTPRTWLKTPSTPQKQPPAKIAVLRPDPSLAARFAAGASTAFSAASSGC